MSGIWRRLTGRREEVTGRTPWADSLASNKNRPPNFVPSLIKDRIWDKDNVEHQKRVAEEDPIARGIVGNMAENVFDDWIVIVDENGEEHKDNRKIQRDFRRLNAPYVLTQALKAERGQGHCYIFVGKEKLNQDVIVPGNMRRIANLDYLTPSDTDVIEWDKWGMPETLEIKVLTNAGESGQTTVRKKIKVKDCILLRTNPYDRTHRGRPATYGCWDALVFARHILYSISSYLMIIGLGAFIAYVKGKVDDEVVAAIQIELNKMSVTRGLVLSNKIYDRVVWEGASGGAMDFSSIFTILYNKISSATGIPTDILRGMNAGQIAGAETNIKSLYQTLNRIQKSVEPAIRELIRRLGYSDDYLIVWNVRYAHDREEESRIDYLDSQSMVVRLQYMTIDEVRKLNKLGPIEGGDVLGSTQKIVLQGKEPTAGENEQEQTRNPEGVNV